MTAKISNIRETLQNMYDKTCITIVSLDLHDGLGHDRDCVGVSLPDGEQRLGEVLQHGRILLVRVLKSNDVLKRKKIDVFFQLNS